MLENHELDRLKAKEFLTIGEVASVIDSTPMQIRKWEAMNQMPKPKNTRTRGKRVDRIYTWPEIEKMKELRRKYRIGAPTAEEAKEREKIREELSSP
jgi:DNA-binding transcriptional MerR regulator